MTNRVPCPLSVIQDHGRVLEPGKWLVGLSPGHSSYRHGLALVARALEGAHTGDGNTLLPFLPLDLVQSHFQINPTQTPSTHLPRTVRITIASERNSDRVLLPGEHVGIHIYVDTHV